MAPWLPAGFDDRDDAVLLPFAHPLVPCFQKTIELTTILRRFLTHSILKNNSKDTSNSNVAILGSVNLDLCRWQESLPDFLRWNKWESTTKLLMPVVAALQWVTH